MGQKIIKCSQCEEEFETGFDYRMHWEVHLDAYFNQIQKETPKSEEWFVELKDSLFSSQTIRPILQLLFIFDPLYHLGLGKQRVFFSPRGEVELGTFITQIVT